MITKLLRTGRALAGFFFATNLYAQTWVTFGPTDWARLGNATATVSSNRLEISNLGASGQTGVAMALNEIARTVTVQFSPVNLGSSGAGVAFAPLGTVNVPGVALGKLALQRQDNLVEMTFDGGQSPVFRTLRLDVYDQNVLIARTTVPANGLLCRLSGTVRITSVTAGQPNPSASEWGFIEVGFAETVNFLAPACSGTRVRLVALNPIGPLQNLLRLELTAQSLASIVIEGATMTTLNPRLQIQTMGQGLNLSWDTRAAVLERANSVNGPWRRVLEGQSSFTADSSKKDNEFYRVIVDPTSLPDYPGGLVSESAYVRQRNILLLLMDDVGIDQIKGYRDYYASGPHGMRYDTSAGNPGADTPEIQKLASAGVTFLNAWASPTCSPARAGIYTGMCSFRHGVYNPSPTGAVLPNVIEGSATTSIAQMLKDAGYANAIFGKWHLGQTTAHRPLAFGWDRHYGALLGEITSYTSWDKVYDNAAPVNTTVFATKDNVDDALAWIKSQPVDQPWMATVAFNAPHSPFEFPPPGRARLSRTSTSDSAKYRSMLEALDRSVGDLLAGIPDQMLEKTTIMIMGDNGTAEDITQSFSGFTPPHSKDSPYEGGLRVPMILSDGYAYRHGSEASSLLGKGRVVSPGRLETNLVQTMDVFATAAEIGRGDASSGVDSISLVPYLSSASASAQRDAVFGETRPSTWVPGSIWTCGNAGWDIAVRDPSWKLIVRNYGSAKAASPESYELYHLDSDPWETSELLADGVSAVEAAATDALLNQITKALTSSGSYSCP